MRSKLFLIILLLTLGLSGCSSKKWFGEKAPTPPELKVDYTKNDAFTKKCFNIIRAEYDKFFDGTIKSKGFVKSMNCSEDLLILGSARVRGRQQDSYSKDEVMVIFNSGLLAEKEQVDLWVRRIYALANMIRGSESDRLSKKDLQDLFNRLRRADSHFVELSRLTGKLNENMLSSVEEENRANYWYLRRDIFLRLLKVAEALLSDSDSPLVRNVFLSQYEHVNPKLPQTQWNKWIESIFLFNKIIFNRTEDVIHPKDIRSMLKSISTTFEKIFNSYALNEKQVWSAKEFVNGVSHYQELIYDFLDLFYKTDGQIIEASSLTRLLELLHVATESEAGTFVSAIVDLKKQLFKSPTSNFSREDIRKLREILKKSIDAHQNSKVEPAIKLQRKSDIRIRHIWDSPFKKTKSMPTNDQLKLTNIFLSYIDQFISLYDGDGDKNITLSSEEASVGDELSSLVNTAQHMIQGYREMLGRSPLLHALDDKTVETIGRVSMALADRIFPNSNNDGKLSRYEILEMLNFIMENNKISNHILLDSVQNGIISPQKHEVPLRLHILNRPANRKLLKEYFPQMVESFSTRKDYLVYLNRILDLVRLSGEVNLDGQGLQVVLSVLRMIEHIFLRFDINEDGKLNQVEILEMKGQFSELIFEAFVFYEAKIEAETALKPDAGWGEWFMHSMNSFGSWTAKTVWYGEDEIHKRYFFKMVTTGTIPTELPYKIKSQTKQSAQREDILRLLLNINKKAIEEGFGS